MSFETLGLLPELLRAVREQGYETPTPIQLSPHPTRLSFPSRPPPPHPSRKVYPDS